MTHAGYQVVAVASRSFASAQRLAGKVPGCDAVPDASDLLERSDAVFLTVPDGYIAPVATELPWRKGQGAVHCSGALPVDVLAPARERGALIGGLHPLQTLAALDSDAILLGGSTFAVEGDGALDQWLEEVAHHLGGYAIRVASRDRPLYHAAAVLACGYVNALLDAASHLWEAMGFTRDEATRALLPLASSTLKNAQDIGTRKGATGPIIRGDVETVRLHLAAIAERAPSVLPLYCQAGLASVAAALAERLIEAAKADDISNLLSAYLVPETRNRLHLTGNTREAVP